MTEGRSPAGQGDDRVTVDRAELSRLRKAVDEGARSDREKAIKIDALGARNVRLAELLKDSRDQLEVLKGEVERLGNPPSTYGVVLSRPTEDATVEVMTAGRRMLLTLAPGVTSSTVTVGATVRLNEALTVLEVSSDLPTTGVTAIFRDVLADGLRARVVMGNDDEYIV